MILRLLALFAVVMANVAAHDIITTNLTFTRDISRIFERRCVSCHGDGASIPLTNYEQVRPWAVDIKEQVLSRAMPPWGAVKGFGPLEPDHALSQEEIMIVAGWVIGGAPKGDPALLSHNPAAALTPPRMRDALSIKNRVTLHEPLAVAGVRPIESQPVLSARIIATLPDGRIEPLVWLYRCDPRNGQAFHFRGPIALPAGTVIESSAPLRFALETATDSSQAQ